MKNAKLAVVLALSTVLVAGVVFSTALAANVADAQGDRMNMRDRIHATVNDGRRGVAVGVISSVQTDSSGNEWLVYGPWRMVLIPAADEAASPDMIFTSGFTMVMKDGTAKHRHQIYDFSLSEWTADETSVTFEGTATITQRDGPVEDVPVTIKILNDSVAEISIDTSVIDHFGESPIYGMVLRSNL
ncbi:MAG: hypothetical protein QXJ74_02285 [Nitrososphaera sp.]|uniref:hypothetical protein n=1 Tax=Nitrososphaera sp. TaxID=1971748 RepID=UPI0017A6DF35|nr:hypothetical protein [Nitrososphaera sp.]NWG36817.1 hypothetical protein [Nitrososphaera sp.]